MTDTVAGTIAEYVAEKNIRVDNLVSYGLTHDDEGWEHYRYTVRIAYGDTGRTVTTPYRMGVGNDERPPRADEVFDSLVSDATCAEYVSDAWEFGAELGYEVTDKRSYERMVNTYDACRQTLADLTVFVGGADEWERVSQLEHM